MSTPQGSACDSISLSPLDLFNPHGFEDGRLLDKTAAHIDSIHGIPTDPTRLLIDAVIGLVLPLLDPTPDIDFMFGHSPLVIRDQWEDAALNEVAREPNVLVREAG